MMANCLQDVLDAAPVVNLSMSWMVNMLVEMVLANTGWGEQARAVFENKTECQTAEARLVAALAL